MASAKQIKGRLRGHINTRMDDFREALKSGFLEKDLYNHYAYGAIWAACHADAISEAERTELLSELRGDQHAAALVL